MNLDFVERSIKLKGRTTYYCPNYKVHNSKDIMIKGHQFYAIWDESKGLWSQNEFDAVRLIDEFLLSKDDPSLPDMPVLLLKNSSSGMKKEFNNYCNNLMTDNYKPLNQKVIFSNQETRREDYATFKLPYFPTAGPTPSWDRLMDVLYEDERKKIEWCIGCIAANDIFKYQKFFVFYGSKGTGKSTILNIIDGLFSGYTCTFNAKALGSAGDQFALEPFKNFPLVAIEHDADLSKIESNARLNCLISHEPLSINAKFERMYTAKFNTFLLMGTNNPVRITDSKSGLIRRIVDISPTGNLISSKEYDKIMSQVSFEYGAIVDKCLKFYKSHKSMFNNYTPIVMMDETNDTFNFFDEYYDIFKDKDCVSLAYLWREYRTYCQDSNISYPLSKKKFKAEAKSYFEEFKDKKKVGDTTFSNVYCNIKNIRDNSTEEDHGNIKGGDSNVEVMVKSSSWIELKTDCVSTFDLMMSDAVAQGVSDDGTERPRYKWENVRTTLKDMNTSDVHYVKVPVNHIVIDFDIKGPDGSKDLDANIEAASKFPPTYAEVSKSGGGLHLHYIYTGGNPEDLSRVYDDNIEVKVYTGNSSLRRKLTLHNDLPIAEINSGLPLREENRKMIDEFVLKNEKALRTMIKRNLNKEYHSNTAPSIDYIFKILEDAYNSGMQYDVTDLRPSVISFAAQSTNQSAKCLKVVSNMKFKSEDPVDSSSGVIRAWDDFTNFIFFDVEVFPNLFVLVWKRYGDNECTTWINPTPDQVEQFVKSGDLIGFNNRDYDNHILYARILGYTENDLYILSQRIIGNESNNAKFREAYNLSFTDIYDFASAGNKMSLKKWEIRLGIHHLELGLPWDQPVDKALWQKVADYCVNDVVSTQAVFEALKSDYTARVILADIAGGIPNDKTNTLTKKLIFGREKNPQGEFRYRNLAEPVKSVDSDMMDFLKEFAPNMVESNFDNQSVLPYFKGYEFKFGKSIYRGDEVGEGGYVYAEPGMYYDVALIDVTSMHPHSVVSECLFGPRYTRTYYELVYGRVYIKHKDWDNLSKVLDGRLSKYVDKILNGEIKGKDLSNALKTAINSVYGLTSAKFKNEFRDDRNIDNIVAKRGALFMDDLKYAVQERGFTVAHIKTDSIKIPGATKEIIDFVMNFGEKYGYHFEHEATYDRICLINDSVYIAKYATAERCQELYGYVPGDNAEKGGKWTPTGARFAEPYVFKTLFSHESIDFKDLCVMKSVSTFMSMDMNERLKDDEHDYRFIGRVGEFCPVVKGVGGGLLYRVSDKMVKGPDGNKVLKTCYDYVPGAKGYRWLESEVAFTSGWSDTIDREYFKELVDDAIQEMRKYGDVEEFLSQN